MKSHLVRVDILSFEENQARLIQHLRVKIFWVKSLHIHMWKNLYLFEKFIGAIKIGALVFQVTLIKNLSV